MVNQVDRPRARRRRSLSHQCPDCHQVWALQVIEHPAGRVVRCRFCLAVREVLPPAEAQVGPARDFGACGAAPDRWLAGSIGD